MMVVVVVVVVEESDEDVFVLFQWHGTLNFSPSLATAEGEGATVRQIFPCPVLTARAHCKRSPWP